MPVVPAATADFAMSSVLAATLNRQLVNLLFQKRCGVREVAYMPRVSTRSRREAFIIWRNRESLRKPGLRHLAEHALINGQWESGNP